MEDRAQFPANIDLSSLDGSNEFEFDGDVIGFSAASAGDIDGDEYADLTIGA